MHASLRNTLVSLVLACLSLASFAQSAGRIDFASGIVRIERGAQILAGVRGTQVLEGDVVVTGPDTQVQIRMVDDAFLALRPNTRLTLDKYRYGRAREEEGVVLGLVHGVMRAFTGAVAANDRERFIMKTPLATVGIRGSGNILAHLGDEGTVNHTISGAHSVTAPDEIGRLVTVVTRPGQTVQVRPGAAPRFVPTPNFIFAAASSAPPAQVAATSTSTTSGGDTGTATAGGGTERSTGGGEGADRSTGGGDTSATVGSTSTERSSTTASTSGGSSSDTTIRMSVGSVPGGGTSTGSSSPSSNVQTGAAPANVRQGGTVGGSGLAGNIAVAIGANIVNPDGGRAGIFATEYEAGYAAATLDASGFLTGAANLDYRSVPLAYHPDNDLTHASVQIRGGTPSDFFRNVEQNIVMGRLQNASIDVTGVECACGDTLTRTDVTAPGGLVFVAYNETPLGVIHSYTGTTDFRLDGSTRPVDARGNVGTLNSATLRANFTDLVLEFAFNLSVNNLIYTANASFVAFDRVRFSVHHDGSPTNAGLNVSCSGSGCATSYRGAVNGAFAGNGTNAWLVYHLFPSDNSDLVNGAMAFVANTVPPPRFQLPLSGTWTMVMIDHYPSVGPGFPMFSTNANAHLNFSNRTADFNFTLTRTLTSADVAAGFQPQTVTASAANLPLQGIGFVAQTGSPSIPSNLNVTCTGCGTAPPVGRFEGYLGYVAPNPAEGGNLNIYWVLTNNTSGTLGYDYAGSSYFGNAPGTIAPAATTAAISPAPIRLTRLPEAIRGPLRPPR